jgi:hypothetical protein
MTFVKAILFVEVAGSEKSALRTGTYLSQSASGRGTRHHQERDLLRTGELCEARSLGQQLQALNIFKIMTPLEQP